MNVSIYVSYFLNHVKYVSHILCLFEKGLFLQKPPFGISWAPCGNFALVQRSYSFAQKAGIKRGCIIASINGNSFRDLDHATAAETLRNLFCKRVRMQKSVIFFHSAFVI